MSAPFKAIVDMASLPHTKATALSALFACRTIRPPLLDLNIEFLAPKSPVILWAQSCRAKEFSTPSPRLGTPLRENVPSVDIEFVGLFQPCPSLLLHHRL